MDATTRKLEALKAKLDKAQSSYAVARGNRQSKGQRFESKTETNARIRRDTARDTLAAFQRSL